MRSFHNIFFKKLFVFRSRARKISVGKENTEPLGKH